MKISGARIGAANLILPYPPYGLLNTGLSSSMIDRLLVMTAHELQVLRSKGEGQASKRFAGDSS